MVRCWMHVCLSRRFDDSAWATPVAAASTLEQPTPLATTASGASSAPGSVTTVDSGTLWETYGYVNDDPAARLILRKLVGTATATTQGKNRDVDAAGAAGDPVVVDYGPPQGRFWRYDAGACMCVLICACAYVCAGIYVLVCACRYVRLSGLCAARENCRNG